MNRAEIVGEINDLLDNHCTGCETKADLTRQHRHDSPELVNHCRNICQVGMDLGALGQQLNIIARPRKKIEEDEEGMRTIKFNMTAEQYLEERKNGKSIAAIAKENGVSDPTVRNQVKQWEAEGKITPADKAPVVVADDTLKAGVVALQAELKPYQDEIERQRLEIESLNALYIDESERADRLQLELELLQSKNNQQEPAPQSNDSLDIIAGTIADLERARWIITRLTSPVK